MQKRILIAVIIAIIGIVFAVGSAFINGNRTYHNVCDRMLTSTQIEIYESNYSGLENCSHDKFVVRDIFDASIIATFVFQLILIFTEKNHTWKKGLIFTILAALYFILLLSFEQILLNTFPSVAYQGWQDAGWTISHTTPLVQTIKESTERPTALPFYLISTFIFTIISVTGLFLAGLLTRTIKKKWVKLLSLFLIAVIFQILLYIVTFPIGLMVVFNYSM